MQNNNTSQHTANKIIYKIERLVLGQNKQHTAHYRQGRTNTLCVVDTF